MSIISEALKKAQSKRAENIFLKSEDDSTLVPESRHSPASAAYRRSKILLYAAIAFAIFVLSGAALLYRNQHASGIVSRVPVTGANMTKGIIKEQKAFSGPVIQKTPPALGGIMYSPSKPQAILNGRIVEKGDAVGEFTVDNILPDVVKISSGEDKFDLRMR